MPVSAAELKECSDETKKIAAAGGDNPEKGCKRSASKVETNRKLKPL